MRKILALLALVATFAFAAARAPAQELLVNGDFGNPGASGQTSVGWTVTEGPLNMATPPVLADAASFAGFADHTTPGADNAGVWLKSFAGNPTSTTAPPQVFADVTQTVAGLPALKYTLSAWSRFETHYAGGLDSLNDGAPEDPGESTTDGAASPTDTVLAIDFLDALNTIIGTSSIELRADGQVNNTGWRQHFVTGVSPVGTTAVQVRGSLISGQINPGVNPQSAFLDDFSLTAVAIPEPATAALLGIGIGLAGLTAIRRRK